MDLPVGALAKLAKVSVRALHHHDAIGLLRPTRRSEAGYRLYDQADLLAAIDGALAALEKGTPMDTEEMFEVFGGFDPRDYEDEVRARWGHTDAYTEGARRTATYTKADWERIRSEDDDVTAAFVAALDRGAAPEDPAVQEVVERHRRHLERWFYTPTPALHAGLGDLYVNDPRFTKNIDGARPGLAAFRREAMRAYARGRSR
jgi:hypothetical protein